MTSGTDWLRLKAKPALPLGAGQAAFVSEFSEALTEAIRMAWLNEHECLSGTWTTQLQRDRHADGAFRWNKWAKNHDVRTSVFKQAVEEMHQGRPTYAEKINRRGKVRVAHPRGPDAFGSHAQGSIPWYVPEGADWDMEAENSVRQFIWGNRSGDSIHDHTTAMGWEEQVSWHERADALCVEEFEGEWDVAPPRRACRYYDDDPATGFIISSDAYIEDGLTNGTSVAQDRAYNNYPEGRREVTRHLRQHAAIAAIRNGVYVKPQRVPVPQVSSDPLDDLLDWLESGWAT